MIKPYVMSEEQYRLMLGLSLGQEPVELETLIKITTSDLFKKNGICNKTFLYEGTADTDGTDTLTNVSFDGLDWDDIEIGAVVRVGSEDGVISDYDEEAETVTLEEAVTATATEATLYIRNFPYGAKDTVAKMINYKHEQATTSNDGGREIASQSTGGLSVSFVAGSGVAGVFGYPKELINGLSGVRKPRFI